MAEPRRISSTPLTSASAPGTDWRHQAACLGVDHELFFPLGDGAATPDQVARAKAICEHCPVVDPCLEFAVQTGLEFGVFGGRTESERRRLRAAGNGSFDGTFIP